MCNQAGARHNRPGFGVSINKNTPQGVRGGYDDEVAAWKAPRTPPVRQQLGPDCRGAFITRFTLGESDLPKSTGCARGAAAYSRGGVLRSSGQP